MCVWPIAEVVQTVHAGPEQPQNTVSAIVELMRTTIDGFQHAGLRGPQKPGRKCARMQAEALAWTKSGQAR